MSTIAELKQQWTTILNEGDVSQDEASLIATFLADLESIAQGEVVAWRFQQGRPDDKFVSFTIGSPPETDRAFGAKHGYTIQCAYSAPTPAVEVTDGLAARVCTDFVVGFDEMSPMKSNETIACMRAALVAALGAGK